MGNTRNIDIIDHSLNSYTHKGELGEMQPRHTDFLFLQPPPNLAHCTRSSRKLDNQSVVLAHEHMQFMNIWLQSIRSQYMHLIND